MPTWNADQYLKFGHERTQPAIDLAARVAVANPRRVVDLGCGPGNSTAVVAQRWPLARVAGVDTSAAMLATARRDHPTWDWFEADLRGWAQAQAASGEAWDVVFSNAALQWVPDPTGTLAALFGTVATDGALAFQVPYTLEVSHQRRIRELGAAWRERFVHEPAVWHVETAAWYYDQLAPLASRVDHWITDYAHVLSGPEGIVEWYRGTGLRPFLDALPDDAHRRDFLAEYLAAITPDHPRRADGKVILYFRRLFVIAYR